MMYSDRFLQYFYDLAHAGVLLSTDGVLRKATVGTAANDDLLEFSFLLRDATIIEVRFKAMGMPATLAMAEYVCRWLENKRVNEVLQQLSPDFLLSSLDLSTHYIHIANLVCRGVQQCLVTS